MNSIKSKPAWFPDLTLKAKLAFACAATLSLLAHPAQAATIVWNGLSGTDTNWSTGGNWIGGTAPGGGDDVKFYDAGAVGTTGAAGTNTPNSLVDGSFGGYIGSLQYGNTNGNHTTVIAAGAILNVTNTGGLTVGTLTAPSATQKVFAYITGAGGTLIVSNPAANVNVVQGNSANLGATMSATLDLSGLDNFVATVSHVAVGTTLVGNANNIQNASGTLVLGKTNIITATFPGTAITVNNIATPTNSVEIGSDNGNAGAPNFLFLGQSNAFFIDSIGVGDLKTTGSVLFNPTFANPTAYFRGTNGNTSRIRFWTVADMSSSGSSSGAASGTNDFRAGSVDILVDTMSLARDRQGGNTGTTATRGTFFFNAGNIDVNTLLIGNQAFTATANVNPMVGVFNVMGSAATLKVNTTLTLGKTTAISTAATTTTGTLNITNGTVLANLIAVGATSTNDVINMTNAMLVVTNTIATNANGLANFRLANSTLGLTVPTNGSLVGLSQVLTSYGATNYIQLASGTVIFSSYPKQFPLIKYTTWAGTNNFGLINIPAWAPGATLVSNGPNKSLDLLLPNDPRPVITSEPSGYSGNPGDSVTFTAGVSAGSVTPLTYQWYNGATLLSDGPTGNGSTISGSATSSLLITSAQPGDTGSYTLVITNVFGSVTSAPPAVLVISAGSVPPNITGPSPTNQTAVAGTNITFTASVSGNPAPSIQWQYNGNNLTDGPTGGGDSISGSTATALTVSNVQYPGSQGAYSIIASNSAGLATNFVFLSVIVPPVITNQPVSLVVTNTQSATFTVVAGGVPSVSYQWYKNSIANPILNATNATFNIPSASPSDTATYFVVVFNSAGSLTSSNVTLTVNSTMLAVSLAPANAASGICYDTPLYITFNQTPVLRNAGKIRIYNVNNSTTPVDTLDLSQNAGNGAQAHSAFAGDGQAFNYFPIIITGNTAAIYPHSGVMTSNQTYYVIVDDGVVADSSGAYFAGITATNAWQFATKAGGPANTNSLVVAADGSGDFVTVQGAVDSIPLNNSNYTLINIHSGNYVEIVDISSKNNVTLRGQSRTGVIVGYANNVNLAPGGTTHARMAFKVNSKNISVESLTISNSTPQGGGQAEALMIESGASRFILNNAEVDSRQDTVLANVNTSQGYFKNSLIQGNFDYIWGGGNLFFTNCEIRTITGTSTPNLVAPRTDNGPTGNWPGYLGLNVSNGFSFVNCQLTRSTNTVTNCTMSDSNGSTNGNAVWINCSIDTGCYINANATAQNSQLLWEYACSNLTDTVLLDTTGIPFLNFTQLNSGDLREMAAASATNWLNGWQPQLAPNILTQPTNVTVIASQTASFTVVATGIPDASYQWLQNGTNAPYATANSATLVIPNASAADASTLSVVVSNTAGSVTSSSAILTVITPTPPVLSGISVLGGGGGVQFSISGTAGLNYRVWATTNLLLSPVTSTWTQLDSNVFGGSPSVFTDAQSTNYPQRFYTVTIP